MNFKKVILLFIVLFNMPGLAATEIYDSGGPLMAEQASYDVTFYDLHLTIVPLDSSINGYNLIKARIVQPIDYFVLDLDTLLTISKITEISGEGEAAAHYKREAGKVWIALKYTRQPGENVALKVAYHGKPLNASRPPWSGGFTWTRTADGSPWIATSCQGEGPDIWWPVKDHISDKPDSMGIHISLPEPLICASNGKLRSVEKHVDKSNTFHWFVSTPINNYSVALNIAPYKLIEAAFQSEYGYSFPFKFWVLPEDYDKGLKIFPEFMDHMRFYEKHLGPYAFRSDKYGVVQTPHLGMEHQSIIAYGARFDNGAMTGGIDWGFDALHHHELSHEWWGNLVTNADWKDTWIHEGFGTYMQALYMEELKGIEGYHAYMADKRGFAETYTLAPKKSMTTNQIWKAPIYAKGAWVLHTLRYLIGESALRESLRRMAYPDPLNEQKSDGSPVRLVSSNDFKYIVEKISGKTLDWFFDVYVHQRLIPELKVEIKGKELYLRWQTADDLPFPMPVDVKNGDNIRRIEIPAQGAVVSVDNTQQILVDPFNWVMLKPAAIKEAEAFIQAANYEQAGKVLQESLLINTLSDDGQNLLRHIEYLRVKGQKAVIDAYSDYIGRYRLNDYRDYILIKEQDQLYLENRRVKNKIYPLSDSQFILLNSDVVYEIEIKDNKPYALSITAKTRSYKAIFIDKDLEQTL